MTNIGANGEFLDVLLLPSGAGLGAGSNAPSAGIAVTGSNVYFAELDGEVFHFLVTGPGGYSDCCVEIPSAVTPASLFGVAIAPDGSNVYVTDQTNNEVLVIATASNTLVAAVPVGKMPQITRDKVHSLVSEINSANSDTTNDPNNTPCLASFIPSNRNS